MADTNQFFNPQKTNVMGEVTKPGQRRAAQTANDAVVENVNNNAIAPSSEPANGEGSAVSDLPTLEELREKMAKEEAAAKEARDRKNAEKKKYQDAIDAAKAKRAKYEGDDEDTVIIREALQARNPALWEIIQTEPERLEKELRDYLLSTLTPEEKEVTQKWNDLLERKAAIAKEEAELKETYQTRYPEIFGLPEKVKATRTRSTEGGSDKPAEGEFTGVLFSLEEDEKFVKECLDKGITSETQMIRIRYGSDFKIQGSTPRGRIHNIREKMGLIEKNK